MRSADLISVNVQYEYGRTSRLLDLVDAWASHVLRLFRESQPSFAGEDAWGVHDFIAALYIRDRIDRGLDAFASDDGAPPTLIVSDELFRSFTTEDSREKLQAVVRDAPREPWWWRRLPTTGPVVTELDAIASRISDAT